MNFLIIGILSVVFVSCSLAPFNGPKSARAIGEKNIQVDLGLSPSPYVSGSYGITDEIEIGAGVEQQFFSVFDIHGKYTFINKQEKGVSLSAFGALIFSFDYTSTRGFYLGPIVSYINDRIELFLSTRLNWVWWDGTEVELDDRDDLFFESVSFEDTDFKYLQLNAGFNFWAQKDFAVNFNLLYLKSINSEKIVDSNNVIPSIGIIIQSI